MRKMFRPTILSPFLIGAGCFLLLIFANDSVAQQRTRKSQTPAKTSGTSAVISRFIKAIQERDFKTVINLTYSYQIEVSSIKSQNPRVLWEKKIGEFYEKKISDLTEKASFWGDYFRNADAMLGDPSQNFRTILYLLPPSCKWHISEVRNQSVTSVVEGRFNQTTVYVMVDYPLDDFTPVIGKRFLKQTMLKFGVRPETQNIANVYQVGEVNSFWIKPYPKEATPFLVRKYKDDILKGDIDAINEVTEIVGWESIEPYLLEMIEQQPPYTKSFDVAINALAEHQVKKAVPIIIKALKGRNPIEERDPNGGYWVEPDKNLIIALQKIGKTEFDEARSILIERLSTIINRKSWDEEWISAHITALASIDDEAWRSFPYKNFGTIVSELDREQNKASVIDNSSPNANKTNAFLGSLRPCTSNRFFRCASELAMNSIKILDATSVEIYGHINEERPGFIYEDGGKFKISLKRKNEQMDRWLVQEISRTESSTLAQDSIGNNNNSNDASKADTLQELLRIEDLATEASRQGDKATVDSLLDFNYTYTDLGNGKTWDRMTFLSKIKRDKSIKSYHCQDQELNFEGEIAILTGTCEYYVENFLIHTNVKQGFKDKFKKQYGKWKFVSSEIIILPNR